MQRATGFTADWEGAGGDCSPSLSLTFDLHLCLWRGSGASRDSAGD